MKLQTIHPQDNFWMEKALEQAQKSQEINEVPVGAVLIDAAGQLLAAAYSAPIHCHDPTAHAELQVIRQAGRKLKNYRLCQTTLYTTLEPCMMCLGAIYHARIQRLVYGAPLRRFLPGDSRLSQATVSEAGLNIPLNIFPCCLAQESTALLKSFFQSKRKDKNSLAFK